MTRGQWAVAICVAGFVMFTLWRIFTPTVLRFIFS